MLSLLGEIFLGWSLGANDASNVFGSAVASRMVKFSTAGILAAVFVVLEALIEGEAGIETSAYDTLQCAYPLCISLLSSPVGVLETTTFLATRTASSDVQDFFRSSNMWNKSF